MSGSNFASLSASLLVDKGEAKPSPIMRPETFPFAQRTPLATVDAPIPAVPSPESKRRELRARSSTADFLPAPRRMVLRLSAREYEILGLLAVKKGTTPQHLLRTALHEIVAEFVEQCGGSCHCIKSGCENGRAL